MTNRRFFTPARNGLYSECLLAFLALATVHCSSDSPGTGSIATGGAVSSSGGVTSLGGSTAPGTGGQIATSGGQTSSTTGGASTTTGGQTSGGASPTTGGQDGAGQGGAQGGGTQGGSSQGGSSGTAQGGAGGAAQGGSSQGGTSQGGSAGSGKGGTAGQAGAAQGGSGGTAQGGTGGTAQGGAGKGGAGQAGAGQSGSTGTGFADTKGGSGGTVIKVTTLAASGAGSLAAALAATGPRIIVFEVGGIIDLNKARLNITQPFVTIAGQTAPSPGITLVRGGMAVTTHDVKIQHLRVRMGDAGDTTASGFEPDVTTDTANAYNIIFDHVSVAWGVDENLSVSGPRFDGVTGTSRKVTISNSIIAEGLYDSVHEKGVHSMGTLIHDYCTEVAVIGNFYAHNDERNPWFKGFGRGVVVNNLVYNPGKWAMRLGAVLSEWTSSGITPEGPQVSIVGNVMRHGANTPTTQVMIGSNSNGAAYSEDNLAYNVSGGAATIMGSTVTVLNQKPTWPTNLVAKPASQVEEYVLAHAGARPKDRDAVDTRLIADYKARKGGFIDSQNDVGGYPTAAMTTRALTVPADVDAWLAQMAAELE